MCRGASILYFNALFFVNPSFLMIPQPLGKNQQNGKQSWLPLLFFKISLKNTSFHVFINFLGLCLSPECFLNFLSNRFISLCAIKNFKFTVFTFLENALNAGIFTHAPHHSKLASRFLSSHPRQTEITHSRRHHFFKNLFPPAA